MIVYVLTKRYSDNSGFMICGVTDNRSVAQAFHAGSSDSDPHGEVFEIDWNDPVRGAMNAYAEIEFDDTPPAPVPHVASVSTISDDDIPF